MRVLGVRMSSAAIGFGLFILFAVAFVGGLGQPLYTYAACISAVCLVLAGLASYTAQLRPAASWLLLVAGLAYLPVMYQRFVWQWGADWVGLVLDMLYMTFLLSFLYSQRPGAARQSEDRDA
jgi:hypothetical protein